MTAVLVWLDIDAIYR